MTHSVDKDFLIQNLAYRTGLYHQGSSVETGIGNSDADIVVITARRNVVNDKDPIAGALRRFQLLENTYRLPFEIVEGGDDDMNLSLVTEVIEIIDPLMVVACGKDLVVTMRRSKSQTLPVRGRKFQIKTLPQLQAYGILDPVDYHSASASVDAKARGKSEWTKVTKTYSKLLKEAISKRYQNH